ncbi:MAG: prepilin-type N-terminal cleavage/methylation domain-containing protein [Rubrivivax sp.]|jgi:general secretion pathway protein H|nr:prepilin-type N-terminal cleavage/methylation domain-containing protein [Rubrivivax sp.]
MQTSAPGSRSPRARAATPTQSGFTLIELMVVVMLVALVSAGVGLALRDGTQDRLEREALRLATLLEMARAEARAAAIPVVWQAAPAAGDPTAAAFRFIGLPATRTLPTHWLDGEVTAQVDGGRGALTLGPEPLIGAQGVMLQLGAHRVHVGTDGLQPFAVQGAGSSP